MPIIIEIDQVDLIYTTSRSNLLCHHI